MTNINTDEAQKSKWMEQLKTYEKAATEQENHPSAERSKKMMEAANKLFQMVMDAVDEEEYFLKKTLLMAEFSDMLAAHYGSTVTVLSMMNRLQERMLRVAWGCENPHDPYS